MVDFDKLIINCSAITCMDASLKFNVHIEENVFLEDGTRRFADILLPGDKVNRYYGFTKEEQDELVSHVTENFNSLAVLAFTNGICTDPEPY